MALDWGKGNHVSLRDRRKAVGYSQEKLAITLGVDRTTVGRWDRGVTVPQPELRPKLAELLLVDLVTLDGLIKGPSALPGGHTGLPSYDAYGPGDDDMIRREFLRAIAVAGALAAVSAEDAGALADDTAREDAVGHLRMNEHLWQVYQLARSKRTVQPVVTEQLAALNESLAMRSARQGRLYVAAGDLFQLAGELAFDGNRHTDAAASYSLAASASKEAGAFDLWACALIRHAYVEMAGGQYREAVELLSVSEAVAKRGDSSLSTRQWVAAVQAEAHAGLGDLERCERALDEAEKVLDLGTHAHNGGWLRFDGSRLAEERGARYVQLGRLDKAEAALTNALSQEALAPGHSFRRRGVVLADLAAIGAKRNDREQIVAYGTEALRLARQTSSGYVARRLQGLQAEIGSLADDHRVAELGAEIAALATS
ncbi:helix-turn-helix transcriptional regulator [Streptomyces reniochalinae]|uniref:XRE family transcriptional regulator n=1 Tax=Streptomyces reniochalinae TaxID=2250578 RepID=A0A367EKP1_9ACTN|nr:helix-turn-helix transcriptional regulator [Streptomyces reniochalinae]RCG18205.1 XRE family transcriptional regulator [Streptomyces reniochalinae]